MNGETRGRTIAALLHATVVGGAGAGAYLLAKGEGPLWVGAVVFVVSKLAGTLINLAVPPRRRRHRPLPGPKQLEGVQHDLHDRIGRLIDLIAWLQSELDYIVDQVRHSVDDMNPED